MNISRIALLSALITVPMFSMENNDPKSNTVNTASTDTSTAEKAGIIAAITAYLVTQTKHMRFSYTEATRRPSQT